MTTKDYELIAGALAGQNPRFNAARFVDACYKRDAA